MKTIKLTPFRGNWCSNIEGYYEWNGGPEFCVCHQFISRQFPDLKKSPEITLEASDRPLKDSIILFVYKRNKYQINYSISPKIKKPSGGFHDGTQKWLEDNFNFKIGQIKKIYVRAK